MGRPSHGKRHSARLHHASRSGRWEIPQLARALYLTPLVDREPCDGPTAVLGLGCYVRDAASWENSRPEPSTNR
ncbi:MAG: hypothetical protein U1F57_11300 [bacterium]